MKNGKTPDTVVQKGIETPRDWSKVPIVGGKRRTLIERIKNGVKTVTAGAILVSALSFPPLVAFSPEFRHFLLYPIENILDYDKFSRMEKEEYVVKPNDNLWDIAGREVEGTYDSDMHKHHQRRFESYLKKYNINRGMSGIKEDGTLITGGEIYLGDLDKDGQIAY